MAEYGKLVQFKDDNGGDISTKTLKDDYIYLISQAATKKGLTEDRIQRLVKWLESQDFFSAPASTKYHDAFPGGLLYHSLRAYNEILTLMKSERFPVNPDSAILVALVHDWCKICFYEPYQKNVKDEETGTWHKETAYRVNQTGIPLGHGVSSMFLASKFFNLTPEESLAIRWHMGNYRVCEAESSELCTANEKVPLVLLLQFADQLACVQY